MHALFFLCSDHVAQPRKFEGEAVPVRGGGVQGSREAGFAACREKKDIRVSINWQRYS